MSYPTLSIVVPVYNIAPIYLEACIQSVLRQTDPRWEIVLCDDCSTNDETIACLESYRGIDSRIRVIRNSRNMGIAAATNKAIEFSTGEYIGFLDNDDELAPNAVEEIRKYIFEKSDIDFMYTDEDKIDSNGIHCEPCYKPDWSPEHFLSCMYVLHFLVARKKLICDVGMLRTRFNGAQDYDLVLRLSRISNKVGHLPKVLYHWRKIPGSTAEVLNAKSYALDAQKIALEEFAGCNVEAGLLPGYWRVRPSINQSEKVTILILTNGAIKEVYGRGKVNLVLNCLESIVKNTTYKSYSVVIVYDDEPPGELVERANLLGADIKFIKYKGPTSSFSYAHKFNYSWKSAETEKVIVLNDDVEVISPDWIEALCEPMEHKGVGMVGGKLFHADGTIQHAGMVLGINGGAAHIYHGAPRDAVGYAGFTHIIRNYSAVTGACILTKRSLLERLDGYDEDFATDYNDVDFCLRLGELGYRTVFTPHCQMYHFENSSFKRTKANEVESEKFQSRWHKKIEADPFYNLNLPKNNHNFRF